MVFHVAAAGTVDRTEEVRGYPSPVNDWVPLIRDGAFVRLTEQLRLRADGAETRESTSNRLAGAGCGGPCRPRCGGARRSSGTRRAPCRPRGAGGTAPRAWRRRPAGRPGRPPAPRRADRRARPPPPRRPPPSDRRSTSSTAAGKTLLPPRLMTSPARPSIHTKPSSSMRARSPVSMKPVGVDALARARRRCWAGRTSRWPSSSDPDVDARVRAADGADLLGVGLGVGRGPPDHLADLGLAVPVEHVDRELARRTAAPGAATAGR